MFLSIPDFLYFAVMLLSLVAAINYRRALRSRQLTLFIPYLALVFIQEVSLYLYLQQSPGGSTAIVYNFYRPVSTSFFAWIFYSILDNNGFRKIIIIMISVYLAATTVTFGFLQSIYKYNNYLYLSGGLIITICAVFFLFNYFELDNHSEEKKWSPVLWITIGIVVFYPVVNISLALYNHLKVTTGAVPGVKVYQLIPRVMSIFMYSCFAWAFYLCKKKNWT
jgi:hypothetical protein